MSTLTVWSPANGASNSIYGSNASFSIARETYANPAALTYVGIQHFSGYYDIIQSPKIFPTDSSVLTGGEVTAVVLSLDGSTDGSDIDFTVEARLHSAWTTDYTLSGDEWVPGSELASHELLATFASASYSSGWCEFTSEAAFKDNITIGGNTYITLVSKDQTDNVNNVPDIVDYSAIYFTSSDGNEVTDPKLVITYNPAPPSQEHTQCHF